MTRFLDAPDPERARRDLDVYLAGHRLVQAIEAEEYARAIYEGYRDGAQYDERPSLERYRREWEEATAERERLERELQVL